jgi:hypothetical protein
MPEASDLTAIEILKRDRLSILVMRDGTELYRSYADGVRPLLELVDWFPAGIEATDVADRVVGGCAARVFTYLRAGTVDGITGSMLASSVLHAAGIPHRFERLVPDIRNRDNSATCPFEELSRTKEDPLAVITAIRQRWNTRK